MTVSVRRKKKNTPGETVFDAVVAVIMVIVAIISLYPFLYIFFYSFSNATLIGPGLLLYPKGFNLDTYKVLLGDDKIPHAFLVSVLRSFIGPACSLTVSSLAAFALSHQHFAGRGFILKYITITMYFSVGLIPTYILMVDLHLTNSFLAYVVPSLFSVFDMIMIKTYMEGLPAGLEESAMIDGANYFTTLFRIIIPLCKPVLAALMLFDCVGQWNAYSDTLIYNSTETDLHTLSYVLMNFIQTSTSTAEQARQRMNLQSVNTTSMKMAMTVITVVPIMCVYPFLQKYFAKGLLVGSIKG